MRATPFLFAAFLSLLSFDTLAAGTGDLAVRSSAQKGLRFLSRTALEWQRGHNGCYGCHVQAVTIEGLSVGKHHQYEVPQAELAAFVENVTVGPTGLRSPGGLSPSTYPKTSRAFAGAGLARYDQYVDGTLRDDLLRICRELLIIQRADGAVVGDHPVMGPVAAGTMQTTYQSMQAWRQCYARSADDAWRSPLRRAERFVTATVQTWQVKAKDGGEKVALQDINHALMALRAAGAGGTEDLTAGLVRELLSRQGRDGGWAFGHTAHPMTDNFLSYPGDEQQSNPLATGQTVYALRMAGMSDNDEPVKRGIAWLIEHQQRDGGWGQSGAAKAEAMWAVIGLVSVDVLTVALRGVNDGERVEPGARVVIEAKDNAGGAVKEVSLFIDDVHAATVQGPALSHALPALKTGKHLIDAVAKNAKGQSSRRRIEVYAGDVFLTQLGTRFDEEKQHTELTLRNIAPASRQGQIDFEVFQLGDKGAEAKADKRVHQAASPSAPGPLSLHFAGKERGRYLARLSWKDAAGKVLQQESQIFFHDSERVQRQKAGEVEGQLGMKGGVGFAADSLVELVDGKGDVVASTRSNEQGNYRFKAVPKGTYTVRAKKEGFRVLESKPVEAAPAHPPAAASMSW